MTQTNSTTYEISSSFFSFSGIASALIFANLGAAYGTYKSGVGICHLGILRPDMIIKSVIPVIMAGILGIYGLIVSVILVNKINKDTKLKDSYKYFASGLCCGLSSLGAGIAIGEAGDAGVRGLITQDRIFVGMMLILIFAEAIGLYGLIISIILSA